MGETARAETQAPSPCERCGAPCEVESDGDSSRDKPRLRCSACNHVFDVAVVQASIGKWTVVDPEGVVRRFSSWQELVASLPHVSTSGAAGDGGSARPTRSSSSAAALLDVTPALPSVAAPPPPRLSLVPGDDPPPLPREARPRTDPPPANALTPAATAASDARGNAEPIEDLADDEVVPASEGVRMPPARSIPPPLPRAASMPPPMPRAASMAPPVPASAVVRSAHPSDPPPPPALSAPPPAPKGGTLRTLPPPPRRDLPAPPPPTIEVDASGASKNAEKAGASDAPPSTRASARASATSTSTSTSAAAADADVDARGRDRGRDRAKDTPPAAAAAEPSGSRWFLPFVAIGIVALGFAYMRRSAPTPESDTAVTPAIAASAAGELQPSSAASPSSASSASSAAATSTTEHAATLTGSAAVTGSGPTSTGSAAPSSGASSSSALEAKAPTTGSVPERGPVGDSQLSLPDVLERAAAARKSGDAAHAKALLERALVLSPGNAEAYGLLGDLARSQGDSTGAKDAYAKALATSPNYYPALLGLADTEWDLGERDSAQRHYITINGLGRAAPDRVKERALGGGASTNASTPAEP